MQRKGEADASDDRCGSADRKRLADCGPAAFVGATRQRGRWSGVSGSVAPTPGRLLRQTSSFYRNATLLGTVARLGVRRPVGYFRVCSLTEGGCVAWMLRLVKIGAEGEGPCTDVMEIRRPDDLVDIANLGRCCVGRRDGRVDPSSDRRSNDANGVRASQLQHAVEDVNSDVGIVNLAVGRLAPAGRDR